MPEGKVEVRGTRRIHGPRDRQRTGQRQRRNTPCLDLPRDQSDGLMANGSDGHQQNNVDGITHHPIGQLGRKRLAHLA